MSARVSYTIRDGSSVIKVKASSEVKLMGQRIHCTICLACALIPVFLVPFLPFLLNGAPFIGDAWVHIGLARDIVATGCYRLSSYSERWPLLNILIAFMMVIMGISDLHVSQVVPLLAGLTSLPVYAFCRRMGLSGGASVSSVLFLTFNPLYSYVTFAGAVMRETSTYYLTMLMLLVAAIALKHQISRAWVTLYTLVGLGIVLGHHFAGLVTFLFLWALMSYLLFDRLRGGGLGFPNALIMTVGFSSMFSSWNLINYLAIGPFFPVFNVTDSALLIASFILLWASLYKDRGCFSSRVPWLAIAAFPMAVVGLRGGVYILAQPVEPISIWEIRNYLVAAGLSLAGLSMGLRNRCLKAYASSAVSMVLFAFLWGYTQPGFVLLIKSLHYFGPLLAVGAGFTAAALLRRGNLGKLLVVAILVFIIYASSTGTTLALNGLGAYSRGEVEAAGHLPPISPEVEVYGDLRASYLFSYTSELTISTLKPVRDLEPSSLIILLKPNWENGFLYGYDWVVKETIAPDEQLLKRGRVYDSAYLQAWL